MSFVASRREKRGLEGPPHGGVLDRYLIWGVHQIQRAGATVSVLIQAEVMASHLAEPCHLLGQAAGFHSDPVSRA